MSPLPRGLVAVQLRRGLSKDGCPICQLRDEAERRYLHGVLWEHVNDRTTRERLRASLGYCPAHTWQMGRLEVRGFGDALGNSIIYEDLTGVVHARLADYLESAHPDGGSWLRQWAARARRRVRRADGALRASEGCRVCQCGAQSERAYLRWLLQALAPPDSGFRELYGSPARVCLAHLRAALATATTPEEPAAVFLARKACEELARLQADLGGFADKHAWDRRSEAMTEGEQSSWLRALAFFGGNDRHPSDSRLEASARPSGRAGGRGG